MTETRSFPPRLSSGRPAGCPVRPKGNFDSPSTNLNENGSTLPCCKGATCLLREAHDHGATEHGSPRRPPGSRQGPPRGNDGPRGAAALRPSARTRSPSPARHTVPRAPQGRADGPPPDRPRASAPVHPPFSRIDAVHPDPRAPPFLPPRPPAAAAPSPPLRARPRPAGQQRVRCARHERPVRCRQTTPESPNPSSHCIVSFASGRLPIHDRRAALLPRTSWPKSRSIGTGSKSLTGVSPSAVRSPPCTW